MPWKGGYRRSKIDWAARDRAEKARKQASWDRMKAQIAKKYEMETTND